MSSVSSFHLKPAITLLTYNIFNGTLTGILNGEQVMIYAYSGGGGGTLKKKGPDDPFAVNNPLLTGQKTIKKKGKYIQRGGSIPEGAYHICKPSIHPHLGHSALLISKLVWDSNPDAVQRSGFFIHGRGNLGSDGCIVPYLSTDLRTILASLKKTSGGTLIVKGFDFTLDANSGKQNKYRLLL